MNVERIQKIILVKEHKNLTFDFLENTTLFKKNKCKTYVKFDFLFFSFLFFVFS